jgi:hypothetical protein
MPTVTAGVVPQRLAVVLAPAVGLERLVPGDTTGAAVRLGVSAALSASARSEPLRSQLDAVEPRDRSPPNPVVFSIGEGQNLAAGSIRVRPVIERPYVS